MPEKDTRIADGISFATHRHYFGSIELASRVELLQAEHNRDGSSDPKWLPRIGEPTEAESPVTRDPPYTDHINSQFSVKIFTFPNWLYGRFRDSFSVTKSDASDTHELRADYEEDLVHETLDFLQFIEAPLPDEVAIELQTVLSDSDSMNNRTEDVSSHGSDMQDEGEMFVKPSVVFNIGETACSFDLCGSNASKCKRQNLARHVMSAKAGLEVNAVKVQVLPQEGLAIGTHVHILRLSGAIDSNALILRVGARY